MFDSLHAAVLHLPVLTTLCALFFSWSLFSRYRAKGGGLHLLWWGIGMVTYAVGTFTEAATTLFGWQPLGSAARSADRPRPPPSRARFRERRPG
jgi:hypothetical protein